MLPAAGSSLVFVTPYCLSAPQQLLLSATLVLGKMVAFPVRSRPHYRLSAIGARTTALHPLVMHALPAGIPPERAALGSPSLTSRTGQLLLLSGTLELFVGSEDDLDWLYDVITHTTRRGSLALVLWLLLSACWHRAWLAAPMRHVWLTLALEGVVLLIGVFAEPSATPGATSGAASAEHTTRIFIALSAVRWAKEAAPPLLALLEAQRLQRLHELARAGHDLVRRFAPDDLDESSTPPPPPPSPPPPPHDVPACAAAPRAEAPACRTPHEHSPHSSLRDSSPKTLTRSATLSVLKISPNNGGGRNRKRTQSYDGALEEDTTLVPPRPSACEALAAEEGVAICAVCAVGLLGGLSAAVCGMYPREAFLPLWIPFSAMHGPRAATQAIVAAVAHACLGGISLAALVRIVYRDTKSRADLAAQRGAARPGDSTPGRWYSTRVEVLVLVSATQQLTTAAVCLAAASSTATLGAAGYLEDILILIAAVLTNSTGVLLFGLFATTDAILAPPLAKLARLSAGSGVLFEAVRRGCAPDTSERRPAHTGFGDMTEGSSLPRDAALRPPEPFSHVASGSAAARDGYGVYDSTAYQPLVEEDDEHVGEDGEDGEPDTWAHRQPLHLQA